MVMTNVPHTASEGHDNYGRMWTVAGWDLVRNRINVARTNNHTVTHSYAIVGPDGHWHLSDEPNNIIRFGEDDLSRKPFNVAATIKHNQPEGPIMTMTPDECKAEAERLLKEAERHVMRDFSSETSIRRVQSFTKIAHVYVMLAAIPETTIQDRVPERHHLVDEDDSTYYSTRCCMPACGNRRRHDSMYCDGHDR